MSQTIVQSSWQTLAHDGSMLVPVQIRAVPDQSPALTEVFSLVYCAQGAGILEVDGQCRPLVASALVPIGPGRSLGWKQTEQLIGWRLDFSPEYINNHLSLEFLDSGQPAPNLSTQQDIYMLSPFMQAKSGPVSILRPSLSAEARFNELFRLGQQELIDQPFFWPCRMRTYLLEIILLLGNATRSGDQAPSQPAHSQVGEWGIAEQVLLAIQMNYGSDLTLDSLARQVNSNRTTVNSLFQKRYGQSVFSYLKHYRLEVAELLLRDSFLPIQEIMERVGWSNSSSFTRSFRESWGLPPGEYRKINSQLN